MKKSLLLLVMFTFICLSSIAQTAGDYRSAGTGDWNLAGSWQIHNGITWIAATQAPSSTDGIITILSPHIITANSTITADQVVVASGATLDKSSFTFTVADGIGPDITVNGTLTVNSTLSGSGAVIINGTMTWVNGTVSCPTEIAGTGILTLTSGGRTLGGTLTNNGTMNFTGNGIDNAGGTLVNNGIINKTIVSNSQATIDLIWSNAGTINVINGEISNTAASGGGRSFTNTGIINISSGALFNNNGYFIHNGGDVTGSGNFTQSTGDLMLNAALTIPASITFNHTGGRTMGAGTLTLTDFTFTDGVIEGGILTLNGTTTWKSGRFSRTIALAAGTIMNITSGGRTLGGTLTNNGTINFTGNGIDNAGGTLINNGIINKTTVSNSQATIDLIWSNAGTINVINGEISNTAASGGGRSFTNTGTINVSAGALFSNNGHFIHNGGGVTGSGNFTQSTGDFMLNAALTVPASITFNHTGGRTMGAGTLTLTDFTFTAGTIEGGILTLNGTTTWISGNYSRTITLAAGTIMNLTFGGRTLGGTLTNNGTMNFTGNGIDNAGGNLINNGIINKTTVTSSFASIDLIWSNAGTINVINGEISNTAASGGGRSFTNTGIINISSGALFNNNGQFIHNGGGVTGSGNFTQSTGDFMLNAALNIPVSITCNQTGGRTMGSGAFTVSDFTFSGGTIEGSGGLILNGTTTWTAGNFSRSFTLAGGNIINANQGGKVLGGTLINDGTINITGNDITNGGGMLINNAIIKKSVVGSSTADIGVPVTNTTSGVFTGTGTLNFSNTFANNGTIAPGNSPGLLGVNGTQPFSANSTLAIEILNTSGVGTGHDQMERNSSLTLGGTLTVTELANLPISSFTIINLTSGTITGSFSNVNLPFGYTMTVGATTVILNKIATTLPLTLLSFQARKLNNTISLDWHTENETNTSHFEIERSVDGLAFSNIGNAVSLNRTGRNQYQFTDQLPFKGTGYYRLKQVDKNNKYTYSRISKVDLRKHFTVSVSPNPATNMLLIEGAENFREVHIINAAGIVVKKLKGAAYFNLHISNFPPGQYFVRLIGDETGEITSFLKQ